MIMLFGVLPISSLVLCCYMCRYCNRKTATLSPRQKANAKKNRDTELQEVVVAKNSGVDNVQYPILPDVFVNDGTTTFLAYSSNIQK